MVVQRFPRFVTMLRLPILVAAWMVPIIAISLWADPGIEIKIGSVSPQYTPTAGPELPEPVSMESYSFEVDQETGRARVVVEYTYPDQFVFGVDGGLGPLPTFTQLPGLKYDKASKTVLYDQAGKRIVCANVRERKFLFRTGLKVEPTGACTVTSHLANHTEDDGWHIHRIRTIDTYFEVQ